MRPDHLDEARIQGLLHGELPAEEAATAREHAGSCPECSRRLEDASEQERLVSALLARLDTPAPRVEVHDVVTAASDPRLGGIRGRRLWNRWAAGILLALGMGGLAYAIPGSPVRTWVDDLIPRVSVRETAPGPGVPGPAPPSASLGGVAVKPGASFLVSFRRPGGGDVRVSLVEGEHVVVRAPADAASYESGPDRLVIDAASAPATFEIDVPKSAPRVEIRVEDSRIFLKEGNRTEPALPGASGTLPLSPPRR